MTLHVKSSIILLTTLIIGIIIGGLGMKLYKNQNDMRVADLRERTGFFALNEAIIRPESDAQRDSIETVLSGFYPRFHEIDKNHRMRITALIDSMQTALKPLLTKEQLERLNERRRIMDSRRGPWPANMDGRMMPPGPPGRGDKPMNGPNPPIDNGQPPMVMPGHRPDRNKN